jgi:hypothetical protein
MGRATPLIRSVRSLQYGTVVIDASDGNRYTADLSSFAPVACFPRTPDAWSQVSVDSYGLALVWACRFEAHADQVIGLATRVERIEHAA